MDGNITVTCEDRDVYNAAKHHGLGSHFVVDSQIP